MKMEDFAESLVRYKLYFPKQSKGKTDVEILLFRNVITEKQAIELSKIKLKRRKIKKIIVRPYTQKQIRKLCLMQAKEILGDCSDIKIEDVAYDLAEALLFSDERMRVYFEKSGIKKELWKESLADYYVE